MFRIMSLYLLLCITLFHTSVAKCDTKPNVIMIMTDDQGYGDLSCHGNPWLKTPALDHLHDESVRFTNFHVSPTCAPTRASLMTGRYSNRCGIWHTLMGRSLLLEDETTVADELQASGYRTGLFGKWHLGDNEGLLPKNRGFQHVVKHGGGGVGQTPDYWGNDYFDDTYLVNGKATQMKGYCTDIWFDQAIKFIKENKDRPFFAYIATNAPHRPFYVDQKYSEPYRNNDAIVSAEFYGMIANIDENMAKLDLELKNLGLFDNTIFIFLTDNGTAAGFDTASGRGFNAGMRGRKTSHYDGGHRVPCFIRWPGMIGAPRDITNITAHIDLLPTLLELCDVKRTGKLPLDGKSLVSLLQEEANADWPDRFIAVDNQRESYPIKYNNFSVMTDRWRLIGNGKQKIELYDMASDPGQRKDVSDEYPNQKAELLQQYENWWNSQEARFVLPQTIDIGQAGIEVCLTAHDWHSENVFRVWNQESITKGALVTGAWAVNVKQPGTYQIALRRWPKERGGAINEGLSIKVTKALVKLSNCSATTLVDGQDEEATLEINLPAGKNMLYTEFISDAGKSLSAYYAYIKKK